MAVQLINIGNVANDGTGDDLREAMIKINTNFEEIDLRDDEQTTVSNLGDTGEGLFAQKLIYDLQFKKLSAGANVTLTADLEKIVIAADSGVSDLTLTADTGNVVLDNSAALTVSGGANRGSSDAIATYLKDADSQLDIDGDGEAKPLTDGLLLIRYLFGFSADSLISGAIGTGATRDTAEEVEAYIQARMPVQ